MGFCLHAKLDASNTSETAEDRISSATDSDDSHVRTQDDRSSIVGVYSEPNDSEYNASDESDGMSDCEVGREALFGSYFNSKNEFVIVDTESEVGKTR